VVHRVSDLKEPYHVTAVKIETKRPFGQALHDTECGGIRDRRFSKGHRAATEHDVAGA
jgi:hypothetical protein